MKRNFYCLHAAIVFGVFVFGVQGCVDSSVPSAPATEPRDIITQLVASPDAIIMAAGDSIPLTVTALNLIGEEIPLQGDSSVKWTFSDSSKVSLSADRWLKAKASTSGDLMNIEAKWTHKASTNSAKIVINITPTRLPIAAIRIVPKDSARSASVEGIVASWFWVKGINSVGDSVAAPRIAVGGAKGTSLSLVSALYIGPLGALFGGATYWVNSTFIGDYWLYAYSTVNGVPMRDSVKYKGLYPIAAKIEIAKDSASNTLISAASNYELSIQRCGFASFKNSSEVAVDIEFDDPAKAAKCVPTDQEGNIVNLAPRRTVVRTFPTDGTVAWSVRDRTTGQLVRSLSGKVTVREPN